MEPTGVLIYAPSSSGSSLLAHTCRLCGMYEGGEQAGFNKKTMWVHLERTDILESISKGEVDRAREVFRSYVLDAQAHDRKIFGMKLSGVSPHYVTIMKILEETWKKSIRFTSFRHPFLQYKRRILRPPFPKNVSLDQTVDNWNGFYIIWKILMRDHEFKILHFPDSWENGYIKKVIDNSILKWNEEVLNYYDPSKRIEFEKDEEEIFKERFPDTQNKYEELCSLCEENKSEFYSKKESIMTVEKFILTQEWLHKYYGSRNENEVKFSKKWLFDYGVDVPVEKVELWGNWHHLTVYQANTHDIVDQCLSWIGDSFKSELEAHKKINILRVPLAGSYDEVLKILSPSPKTILELGTGGDSAISTSVFLFHLERFKQHKMLSIDRNPLSTTWERYKNVPFWQFRQSDSIQVLNEMVTSNVKWDLVFIDTDHSFTTTEQEINLASQITDCILLDDALFPGNDSDPEPGGVKEARTRFMVNNFNDWEEREFGGGNISLLIRKKGKPKKYQTQTPKKKFNLKSELPKGVLNE